MEPAFAHVPSQPPVVFRDGFGERRRLTGPARADNVDVLYLRSELTEVPAFEFALRERASRLAPFHHPLFARVQNVERLGDRAATMVIVSETIEGVRLSDLLTTSLPLEIPAVLHLLRQLVPAVAALHTFAPEAAHGTLGPERIIITPDARVVIVEHVMGAAIERLRYSHEQYWKDLRVAFPRPAVVLKADQRTDVTQIGIVALSLILGRLLHPEEYPRSIGEIVSSAWRVSAQGAVEPPVDLRAWLARAVQLDARTGFASAVEAEAALEGLMGNLDHAAAAQALATFIAEYHELAKPTVEPVAPPARPAPKLVASVATPVAGATATTTATTKIARLDPWPDLDKSVPRATTSASGSLLHPTVQDDMPQGSWASGWIRAAVAAILLVGVGGGAIAAWRHFASANATAASSPLVVDATPRAAEAVVESTPSATPLAPVEAGVAAPLVAELTTPQAAPLSGWISVAAPADVQIYEGGRLLGNSQTEPLVMAAGTHQLSLVNEALGYQSTRSVAVASGKVLAIKIDFPKGTIAVNATPWAEVWIDGASIGETPIGNVPLVIGSHDVVFRHPDLGEQRQVVIVTATTPVRLSVDMRKP